MAKKRSTRENQQEFDPFEDSRSLINQVLAGSAEDIAPRKNLEEENQVKSIETIETKVTSLKPISVDEDNKLETKVKPKEEFAILKFKVPKNDLKQVKRILGMLEEEIGAKVDLANLGRGWITRLITAEKELIEAAHNQKKLKTPNSRNPAEIAQVDRAMAVIQSAAFRRAKSLR